MKIKKYLILFILHLLFGQIGFAQIQGWEKIKNDVIISYFPNDLKKGENFIVIVYPLQKIKNKSKKDFFSDFLRKYDKKISNTHANWEIKPINQNDWTAQKTLNYKGIERLFIFRTIELRKNEILLFQIAYDKEADYAEKYLKRLSYIFDDIEKMYGKKIDIHTTTETSIPPSKPTFNIVKKLSKHKDYIMYGDIEFGIGGADGVFEAILTFHDGSFTSDINTILNKGAAFSKNANPDKWGNYRIINKKLELKWNGESNYEAVNFYERLYSITSISQIEGCWKATSGSSTGTSTSIAIDKYCFSKNSRFSIESVATVATGSGGGYSGTEKQGWYQVKNNVIQLHFDNNKRQTVTIGITKDKKQLSIGNLILSKK